MDIEKKAREIVMASISKCCHKPGLLYHGCHDCEKSIEQFGKECAAQAFEDMSALADEFLDSGRDIAEFSAVLLDKAAALRSESNG